MAFSHDTSSLVCLFTLLSQDSLTHQHEMLDSEVLTHLELYIPMYLFCVSVSSHLLVYNNDDAE